MSPRSSALRKLGMVSRSPCVLQYKPSFFEHRQTLQKLELSPVERAFDVFIEDLVELILLIDDDEDGEDNEDADADASRLNASDAALPGGE